MATAKILPSGQYRVRAYVGKDKNGKDIRKSFTAPTKKQAEYMAAEFVMSLNKAIKDDGATISFEDAMTEIYHNST